MNYNDSFSHQTRRLGSEYTNNAFVAGAPPRVALEEFTVLPRPPAGFEGPLGCAGKGKAARKRSEVEGIWNKGRVEKQPD